MLCWTNSCKACKAVFTRSRQKHLIRSFKARVIQSHRVDGFSIGAREPEEPSPRHFVLHRNLSLLSNFITFTYLGGFTLFFELVPHKVVCLSVFCCFPRQKSLEPSTLGFFFFFFDVSWPNLLGFTFPARYFMGKGDLWLCGCGWKTWGRLLELPHLRCACFMIGMRTPTAMDGIQWPWFSEYAWLPRPD